MPSLSAVGISGLQAGEDVNQRGETGALVQFKTTGLYAQDNASAVRRLDSRKIAAALVEAGK